MRLSPLARQIVALGLALCAVALSLAYPLRNYVHQQAAEKQAVAEQHELEDRISDLQAHLAALNDPAYIRAEAKRRLQYVTPGDTVYVVKVPQADLPSSETGIAAGGEGAGSTGADEGAGSTGADEGAGSTGADGASDPWYASLWGTLTGDGG